MARTDIDDDARDRVMRRFALTTKRDALNTALRLVAAEPLDVAAARGLRGSGWEADLSEGVARGGFRHPRRT